jgi:biopolymer transport protein ExbD
MRRRFSDRHQLHTLSELNVTPLLDLAFVLLIIFMITTPLMENSTDLVLPSGDAPPSPANMDKVQSVSLHADGRITLNEATIALDDLASQLATIHGKDAEVGVLIRSHSTQTVQTFSEVLDAVKRSGIKRIGFVSTPRE